MKKNFFFTFFLTNFITLISLVLAVPLSAQSPEASTAAQADIVIEKSAQGRSDKDSTDQILNNLERLAKDPNANEQIKEQYDDVSNKNRGFIAQVASFKDGAIKLVTLSNEELFITPDKSTTILKKGESVNGENLELSEWFNVDDWLVLIGVQDNDVFLPRRIIISSESLAPVTQFVLRGQIKTVSSSKIDVQILGTATEVETFKINKDVNLVDQNNETISTKDLSLDSSVLLIGTLANDKKTLQTLRLL